MTESLSASSPNLLTGGSVPEKPPKGSFSPRNTKNEQIANDMYSSEKQYVDTLKNIVEVIIFFNS